jgi:hypothetical protein
MPKFNKKIITVPTFQKHKSSLKIPNFVKSNNKKGKELLWLQN